MLSNGIPVYPALSVVALYALFAYCLYRISLILADEHPMWAWIPILQIFQMFRMARVRYWWILVLLLPFVNIFVAGYVWAQIALRRGKKWWIGALMVVPGIDIVVLLYLAFSKP